MWDGERVEAQRRDGLGPRDGPMTASSSGKGGEVMPPKHTWSTIDEISCMAEWGSKGQDNLRVTVQFPTSTQGWLIIQRGQMG